jgi:hypothetical protein
MAGHDAHAIGSHARGLFWAPADASASTWQLLAISSKMAFRMLRRSAPLG